MSASGPGIVLVGLMGAGKSSVGQALAARRSVPYFDNDTWLQLHVGASKAALLASHGEDRFRELEADAALALLDHPHGFVASLPSGAVLTPRVREALEVRPPRLQLVWLRAQLETLIGRLSRSPLGRPFLTPDPATALRRLAPPREAAFAALADRILDVEGRTPEQLAEVLDRTLPTG